MTGKILKGPSTVAGWHEMQRYRNHQKTTGDRPDVRLSDCNFDKVAHDRLCRPPDPLTDYGFEDATSDNLRLDTVRPYPSSDDGPDDGGRAA